jgi:C4-dicarboxylate transporter DctQ subunit
MKSEGLMPPHHAQILGVFERIGALYDRIIDLLAVLASLLVIGTVLLLSYEVVMRYLFTAPPAWAWEVAECMLCPIAFLGAAWLLRKSGHVSVDIIYSQLDPKVQSLLSALTSAAGMIICFILTWAGVEITIDHFESHITVPGYLDIPKAAILLFIPIGCFMLSLQFLRHTYNYLMRWISATND